MKRKTLWTRDFTLITVGTIISAVGGTAMSFALSIVVFDNTGSTWLTGVFTAVMMIPSTVLPILTAPFVDSHCRQKIIVRLDALCGLIDLGFAAYLYFNEFSYAAYMLLGFTLNCIGTIYYQAYGSLYPELISEGFAQKGYSVSSTLYPLVSTVITPVAAIAYKAGGIMVIFIAEGVLLLIASTLERFITPDRMEGREKKRFSLKAYLSDVTGGIRYLKNERGVRSIYGYMAASQTYYGTRLMTVAHFESGFNGLTTAMYSLLISSETLGRMVGGLFHYIVKIPPKWRFGITEKVYLTYEALDSVMLLFAYPVMVVVRFLLGFLGVNSATLREAAVQKHLPSEVRARVEALFLVLVSFGQMLMGLIAGALGEVLPYRYVPLIFGGAGIVIVWFFIIRNRRYIKPLYEAEY